MRIVDPNTNRDILTGEEVPPSAVVTPTTATPPEIVAAGVVPAPVVAADEVEAPLTVTAPVSSETEEMAPTPTEEAIVTSPDNTNVALIEEVKAEEKIVPTVVAATAPVVVATPPAPTPPVPATVTVLSVAATPPAPVIEKEVIAVPVTQENGEVPSPSEPPSSSASPTPVSTSVSPEQGEGIKPIVIID